MRRSTAICITALALIVAITSSAWWVWVFNAVIVGGSWLDYAYPSRSVNTRARIAAFIDRWAHRA